MTDSTDSARSVGAPSRLGRTMYSGVLLYMAVDGFRNNETRVEIARDRGVPLPEALVPAATALLFAANLGVLCWKYPRASAAAIAVFFLTTTPAIHSFWTMEGHDRHENRINFLKNVALLGGALLLLERAGRDDDGGTA